MKKLTKKQAWEAIIEKLKEKDGYKEGLCIYLDELICGGKISEKNYNSMHNRIVECKNPQKKAYLFPLNDAGRKKRIKLCRKFIQELS